MATLTLLLLMSEGVQIFWNPDRKLAKNNLFPLMSEGWGYFATLKEVDWKLEPVELIGSESWKYFGTLTSNFDRSWNL